MTDDAVTDRDRALPALLARRARAASDARLAIDVAGGVLALTAAVLVRPPGWHLLAMAALCFVAFGGWGISDRAIGDRPAGSDRDTRLLRAVRAGAAILGAVAALALLLGLFALSLGTWIS